MLTNKNTLTTAPDTSPEVLGYSAAIRSLVSQLDIDKRTGALALGMGTPGHVFEPRDEGGILKITVTAEESVVAHLPWHSSPNSTAFEMQAALQRGRSVYAKRVLTGITHGDYNLAELSLVGASPEMQRVAANQPIITLDKAGFEVIEMSEADAVTQLRGELDPAA